MSAEIERGATLWARQTIESEVFLNKPDKWFKIWFYLINRVSHKDTSRYRRGETFYHQDWICEATGATPDQVKKCLTWLRSRDMIRTRRSTRGTWLFIPSYSRFQTLDNYYSNVEAPDEARKKHERSTKEAPRYNKNEKNEKKYNKIDFKIFWDLYDKKVGMPKSKAKWEKLTLKEQQAILEYIPRYKKATPDKKFRKNPETFFNNRGWEDEILEEVSAPVVQRDSESEARIRATIEKKQGSSPFAKELSSKMKM